MFTVTSTKGLLQNKIFEAGPNAFKSDTQFQNQNEQQRRSEKAVQWESANIVGDIMWPIIFFLKIFGHSPLSYVVAPSETKRKADSAFGYIEKITNIQETARKYTLGLKSLAIVWSIFCAFSIIFGWISYAMSISVTNNVNHRLIEKSGTSNITGRSDFQNLQEKSKDESQPSIFGTVLITNQILLAVIQASEVLLAWTESSSLAQFLNKWTSLQQTFQTIFPYNSLLGERYKSLKRFRNVLLLIYVAIPSAIFVPSFMYFNNLRLILFPCAWQVSALSLMEDVKAIMTYRILAESFGQIRDGISHSLKFEGLTPRRIQAWRKLVHSVKLQVDQAGLSQKNHQLVLLGGSVGFITCCIFILLHVPWRSSNGWLLSLPTVGFLCLQVGRLYLKILAANSIVNENRLIGDELVLLDHKQENVSIQLEVKFLHDLVTENPPIVSFGSYVSLNKSLLLGVGSQVVTYLIVLMQFKD